MTDPKRVADKLVGLVKQAEPAAQSFARVAIGGKAFLRFAVNEITTAGDTDEVDVSLTVGLGQRHATARTTRLDDAALAELATRALAMAKLSPEDPEHMPVLGAQTYREPGPDFDVATGKAPPEMRADAAKTAIAIAKEKGVVIAGFISTWSRELGLSSSAGLSATHRASRADLSATARTTDGTGSGWASLGSQKASDIDARALATRAVDKAIASQKPRELEPGRYTVVLEPACVATLVAYLESALDARAAEEGRSFFSKPGGGTRFGEQIIAKGLSLKSDPFDAATPGAPFDAEGFALAPTTWFDAGKLVAMPRTRYWAKKAGGQPTGEHQSFALAGAGGAADLSKLVASVDRGLLVTRLWYVRWLEAKTMTITGLTRDGVFLIDKGKITAPVANFRFNDSPARVFSSATAWTADAAWIPWGQSTVIRAPAIVAHDFHMASKSAAI